MTDGLRDCGYESMAADCVQTARELLATEEGRGVGMILLDVMMPGESGWRFLESLRASGSDTPVMFLTARHEVQERVKGLELGADDYIVKPFDFSELRARIEAVARRRSSSVIRFGELEIDRDARKVRIEGRTVDLTAKDYDLLLTLCRSPGRVLSKEDILREVWGMDFDPQTNLVTVAVARLRSKLDSGGTSRIQTIVGEGYTIAQS